MPVGRTRLAVAALLCALLAGCGTATKPQPASAPVSSSTQAEGTCALDSLPPEVSDTVDLIESGGPFPYPRNDGVVFGNFEGRLPKHERGYYHEYTVPTPGAKNRGARRIVTGGKPLNDPPEFFYTGNHYESFCLIGGL
ncbi:ribonuclease [Mycobacterium sp. SWH-M3]|nr:ribonuclease [Mycobacterium sp. SWH-M3]